MRIDTGEVFWDKKMIVLNIGGQMFYTSRETLEHSNSYFSGALAQQRDTIFVDRDPTHFRHVLNWMRGVRCLPKDDSVLRELYWEADFYALTDMTQAIQGTARVMSHLEALSAIALNMPST